MRRTWISAGRGPEPTGQADHELGIQAMMEIYRNDLTVTLYDMSSTYACKSCNHTNRLPHDCMPPTNLPYTVTPKFF